MMAEQQQPQFRIQDNPSIVETYANKFLGREEVEIDDKIFLATTRPPFGGLRFVCPHLNRRVRKLYLSLAAALRMND